MGQLDRRYSNLVRPDPDQEMGNQVQGPDPGTLVQGLLSGNPFPHAPLISSFNAYSQGDRIDIH